MARTIRARTASTCPLCLGPIRRGDKLGKSYRLQEWVHITCLIKDVTEEASKD